MMLQTLKSLIPAYGGYSIARDEKVILIKGAIPGEVVEVEIGEKKKDYALARVVNVLEPSEYRVEPPCRVFGVCGGCQLQYIEYEKQLAMKEEILLDSLNRLGGIDTALGPLLAGSQWHYRHRAQFKVSRNGEIGFFRESSRDVITFDECPLMTREINGIFREIREKCSIHNLTEIHVAAGDTPVALLRGRDYDSALFETFIETGLSGIAFNDAIAYGGAFTGFDLNGLRYTVSPWTFFQAHWDLNRRVSDLIREELMPLAGKRILDLYAGAGNFSIPLAGQAEELIAVEENRYAAEDGARNLELNGIKNCRFIRSSAEKYRITRKFDIIILDPPRPGLTSEVVKKILENPAEQLVYLSCNPATLARDLKKLKETYEISSVRLIDFFPNTFHIEAIAFLQKR
ncbi:MAG: class I SAM-dependent RNA methyltransferase [Nitrospirae bacterium]|nr:class I SAM-dependent RNA methyltransferase [Nitrospirota bacterium]